MRQESYTPNEQNKGDKNITELHLNRPSYRSFLVSRNSRTDFSAKYYNYFFFFFFFYLHCSKQIQQLGRKSKKKNTRKKKTDEKEKLVTHKEKGLSAGRYLLSIPADNK